MALRPYALLPRQYDDAEVLTSTVDAWGRALWLICPGAELVPSSYGRPYPKPRRYPFDALLVINNKGAIHERVLHDVRLRPANVDSLPNGRILLHGYGDTGGLNSQIYGRDGRHRRSFAMGKAVQLMMADQRHNVWSAYFDEGVYIDPISYPGLVRWDSGGNQQWGYAPPEGVEHIDTVYAFNVGDGVAWANYYPTFPLVRAEANGHVRVWKTPVVAPSGIAVHGEEVLLLGGGRGPGDRIRRCRLGERDAVIVEEAQLTMPNGLPLKRYAQPVGRGRHLYLRSSSRQWYVVSA
ncbi:hypothetical protein [Streptomyces sp. NPDC003077]|uniref:hypothetical protein n=1 Tax=Streptomyces sp. NPDC003077 TaxID=3154443 RepID=UPI0033B3741E